MSHQRPIFQSGLFGKANQIVLNNLLEVADTVQQYQAGLINSQGGILEDRQVVRSFLAKLNTATATSTYQWTYSGKPCVFSLVGISNVNDSADEFTGAKNLRELFNITNPVDGMDPTNPDVTVGPVGSSYLGCNEWTTANLEAVVIMYVTVSANGSVVYFFDRPNPVRCLEDCFGGGE